LPDQVRSLRSDLGVSRADLARFVGVSQITVIRWESGGGSSPRGVSLVLLVAIQQAFARTTRQALSHLVRTGPMNHALAIRDLLLLACNSERGDPDDRAETVEPERCGERRGLSLKCRKKC
jgi:transcriptional regulator with XRE-family HTH domain